MWKLCAFSFPPTRKVDDAIVDTPAELNKVMGEFLSRKDVHSVDVWQGSAPGQRRFLDCFLNPTTGRNGATLPQSDIEPESDDLI
jgi:hypothetical protein